MGWNPFKTTRTYQYWNVVTTPLTDDALPDGYHDFAIINEAVNGIDYFKSLEYLEYNAGSRRKYRQLTKKFATKDYYEGFAEINIGNNYVPASLVKARINPSNPSAVTILNSSVIDLDYAEWVSAYLVNEFNLDTSTNTFRRDNVEFYVDLTTADDVANTVEVTNTVTSNSYTLDLPPEPLGSAYNVTYTVDIATPDGPKASSTRTWTYDIGSGVYPELDTYTTLPENDPTVFQIMPPLDIRRDGKYLHDDENRHKDYDDYANFLGINSKDLAEAFAEHPDMDKLDHVAVSQGVDLKAKDKHSLKYCIEFITKLKALADTHTFNYEVDGANDNIVGSFNTRSTRGFTVEQDIDSLPVYVMEQSNVATELIDVTGIDLIVSFDESAYGLRYSHIDIQHHSKADVDSNSVLKGVREDPINLREYGRLQGPTTYKSIQGTLDLTSTITGIDIPDEIRDFLNIAYENALNATVSTMTYYKINADGSVDSYMIVSPVITHYVRDVQSQQHKIVYIDLTSDDGGVYLPLDWRIIKSYNNQAMTSIATSSLHLEMYYAFWEQKEEWDFQFIILVLTIIVIILSAGTAAPAAGSASAAAGGGAATAGTAYLSATAATLAATLGITVSTAYVIIAVVLLASMGVFGEDYVVLGQVGMLLITMGTSGSTLGANSYTAMLALDVVNIMNTYKMQHLISDAEQMASATISQGLLIEELQDDLDAEYEASGYYYSAINRRYVQQGLLNIQKVDTFDPMPSAQYFQRVLKTTSPRHTYRLQYNYT